jgi:hypothetical protein
VPAIRILENLEVCLTRPRLTQNDCGCLLFPTGAPRRPAVAVTELAWTESQITGGVTGQNTVQTGQA